MARDLRAYLWDIKEASKDIELFTTGKTAENYRSDPMLRAAVERKLENHWRGSRARNAAFSRTG